MRFFRVVQNAGNLLHGWGKTFEVIVGCGRALMSKHFLNFSQGSGAGGLKICCDMITVFKHHHEDSWEPVMMPGKFSNLGDG